jgi:hypothetical protein
MSAQQPADIKTHLAENLVQNTELSLNIGQNIITTTEDKVRLAVLTHLKRIEDRRAWLAPGGIFLSILAAFVTADFKNVWLPAATWQAVFFICSVASLVWLIISIVKALRAPTVDDFIATLRVAAKKNDG